MAKKDAELARRWQRIMNASEVLRLPKANIATFGQAQFSYHCLSALNESSTKIRSGTVYAQRPTIILPHQLRGMFEGFFPEAKDFVEEFFHTVGEKLRTLGYTFRHELKHQETAAKSFANTLETVENIVGEDARASIIRGPDAYWQVSLLKFTMDMIAKSFQINVRELEERGLFDPEQRLRYQAERMFAEAKKSKEDLQKLADFLRQNGIFQEHEDRFFELVQQSQHSE